jgi:hypothetical protein
MSASWRQLSTSSTPYYDSISGVYELDFPNKPPLFFNFTAPKSPQELQLTMQGTKVKVVEYGTVVEVVFQDLTGESHPMHLHGFSFYVVGRGFGNFDKDKDPATYNLVDPPYTRTPSQCPRVAGLQCASYVLYYFFLFIRCMVYALSFRSSHGVGDEHCVYCEKWQNPRCSNDATSSQHAQVLVRKQGHEPCWRFACKTIQQDI